jgi:hypothetical protein
MHSHRAAVEIDQLRTFRVRAQRSQLAGDEAAKLIGALKSASKSWGGVQGALDRVLPAELAGKCSIESCKGGQVKLRVRDHASRYRADRWLRSGGLQQLREAAGVAVQRVTIVV